MMKRERYLLLEFCFLFLGMPLLILFAHDRKLMIALLWLGALLAYGVLRCDPVFTHRAEWNISGLKAGWREVMKRFFLLAPLLLIFTWVYEPHRLFSFPLERPKIWALVMLLYPILSVWPQELIFRSFLFHRYQKLFYTPTRYLAASAFTFGFAHIVFFNWIALVFTAYGGYLFARSYVRYRSLALICLEHALYGCFIFTIGLGWYFYGTAWQRP